MKENQFVVYTVVKRLLPWRQWLKSKSTMITQTNGVPAAIVTEASAVVITVIPTALQLIAAKKFFPSVHRPERQPIPHPKFRTAFNNRSHPAIRFTPPNYQNFQLLQAVR